MADGAIALSTVEADPGPRDLPRRPVNRELEHANVRLGLLVRVPHVEVGREALHELTLAVQADVQVRRLLVAAERFRTSRAALAAQPFCGRLPSRTRIESRILGGRRTLPCALAYSTA